MSSNKNQKYVHETLTMPQNMPLFNYNLNFQGLRQLMETINIQTNTNTEQLQSLKQQLQRKLQSQKLKQQQEILRNGFSLGKESEKLIEDRENLNQRITKKDQKDMDDMEVFVQKMNRLMRVLEFLVVRVDGLGKKVGDDQGRHQRNIDQSFRRIDQRVSSSLQSMTKTINHYFTQTNKKLSNLQSDHTTHKRQTQANFQTVYQNLNQKTSDAQLKSGLAGLTEKIKSSILGDLDNDQMKRLAALNQYSNKLQGHMTDYQLKIKSAKKDVKELAQKVAKALPIQNFQVEKHRIYEKLSQYKSKIDDLSRKNQEFFDFRKTFYESSERTKHSILQLDDQIKKLGQKGSSYKKMQDMTSILDKLDPHLICQLGNQVKLHQKQLGKLQKQVVYLQTQLQETRKNTSKPPQINNGQTADLIIKMIKQYMTNLDFQGRMKKNQKDIHDIGKRSQNFHDLEKKIYLLSKECDVGAIMKELKKKCDEENTRKDYKILDSKVEKLFDFYKQVRRELQQLYKKSSRNIKQPNDNASLTTKKLYSPNCISCTPRHRPQSSRRFSRSRIDATIDQDLDQIKHSLHVRGSNN